MAASEIPEGAEIVVDFFTRPAGSTFDDPDAKLQMKHLGYYRVPATGRVGWFYKQKKKRVPVTEAFVGARKFSAKYAAMVKASGNSGEHTDGDGKTVKYAPLTDDAYQALLAGPKKRKASARAPRPAKSKKAKTSAAPPPGAHVLDQPLATPPRARGDVRDWKGAEMLAQIHHAVRDGWPLLYDIVMSATSLKGSGFGRALVDSAFYREHWLPALAEIPVFGPFAMSELDLLELPDKVLDADVHLGARTMWFVNCPVKPVHSRELAPVMAAKYPSPGTACRAPFFSFFRDQTGIRTRGDWSLAMLAAKTPPGDHAPDAAHSPLVLLGMYIVFAFYYIW